MDGKRYDELSVQEAKSIEDSHVCAQCWGPLTTLRSSIPDRTFKVICPNCGEDRGFVTREYAEKRKGESRMEAVEAQHNIGKQLGIKTEKHDRDQLIKELYG